ncbi:MAG: methyltransferase domain-containing protein [bacterium]
MILGFDELKRHRRQVAMVDGAFDPLHHGHIAYFRRAREQSGPLLCNIAPDRYVETKHPLLLEGASRALVIDALSDIAYTHVSRTDTETVLRELCPTHFVKGKDWEGRLPLDQVRVCDELGIELVFVDTMHDSSSARLRQYLQASVSNDNDDLDALEQLIARQRPPHERVSVDSEEQDGGRAPAVEGRHAVAIREAFSPRRVLDVGCGRGTLLRLLSGQAVEADGVDVDPRMRELAPPAVRSRIQIQTISDRPDPPDDAYDLVMCRNVLEHLSLLQIADTVRHLCRLSARYVYVAGRCRAQPAGLLDVTTPADHTPSQRTLVSPDLLRLLLVLQGFRRRADLEGKLDETGGQDDVLVYERGGT